MSRHIEVLIDNIKNEKCILMLGPDIATNADGIPLHQDLITYLNKESDLKIEFDIDNFILFKNKTTKTFFYSDFKKFYDNNSAAKDIHKKIAVLPFHVIISLSPDLILKKTFEQLGLAYNFQHYSKKQNPFDVSRPSRNNPLIYNLFGSITDEDSLIITHDDLFEFIFTILGGEHKLPPELRVSLQNAKVFLFLGFDFTKWYMKLILRLFDLHKDILPMTLDTNTRMEKNLKNFYINNFEMEFINTEAGELIRDLYKEGLKQNILKAVNTLNENPISLKVKMLLKEDHIEDALIMLEDYLETKDNDLYDMVIQISGAHSGLRRKISKGILSKDEIDLQTNKIRDSILNLANDLKTI